MHTTLEPYNISIKYLFFNDYVPVLAFIFFLLKKVIKMRAKKSKVNKSRNAINNPSGCFGID